MTPSPSERVLSVEIEGKERDATTRSFRVRGRSPGSPSIVTRTYVLGAPSQRAYRKLFERLAEDFGTRPPTDEPDISANEAPAVRTLLDETLSPSILYGYGDPGGIWVPDDFAMPGGTYFVTVTSNDAPDAFPIVCSRDLRDWRLAGFMFPRGTRPQWASDVAHGGEFWAPEIHRIGEQFVACFAAREADGEFAIGLAHARTASGPFAPAPSPLVRGGAIDPNLFVDDDGSITLLWKTDDNAVWPGVLCELLDEQPDVVERLFPAHSDAATARLNAILAPWTRGLSPMERFFVQQPLITSVASRFPAFHAALEELLGDDRYRSVHSRLRRILGAARTVVYAQTVDPRDWTLRGEPRVVLRNDLPWEGHIVEGHWLTKQAGKYYMFYSGNDFSTAQYGIGVAVADSPLGPYVKQPLPFLRSTREWWAPGHPSIVQGANARPWLLLHAFRPDMAGYKEFRALLGLPLVFANGTVRAAELTDPPVGATVSGVRPQ